MADTRTGECCFTPSSTPSGSLSSSSSRQSSTARRIGGGAGSTLLSLRPTTSSNARRTLPRSADTPIASSRARSLYCSRRSLRRTCEGWRASNPRRITKPVIASQGCSLESLPQRIEFAPAHVAEFFQVVVVLTRRGLNLLWREVWLEINLDNGRYQLFPALDNLSR
jgi:hypothetical protein